MSQADAKLGLSGNIRLTQGAFVLDTGDFILPTKGVTAIFGRSGSGKTTFLRALAGFEERAEGHVQFGQHVWQTPNMRLPVHKRQLGFVFQEASLFLHLNVEKNLRYGLARFEKSGWFGILGKFEPFRSNKRKGFITFEQAVEWLGLAELLERQPHSLSGGERQRVAIGRTLLSQPTCLMLDEPMAALDLFSKRAILPYLERLRDELAIPIYYISHSPEEVERLADTVIFMEKGRITAIEPINQALNRVGTPLYQDVSPRCVLTVTVIKHDHQDGLTQVKAGEAELWVPLLSESIGAAVRVVIAAQNVSLLQTIPNETTVLNHLAVTIVSIDAFNDTSLLIRLEVKGEPWPLLANVTKRSVRELKLKAGQHWFAAIKSASLSAV